MCTCICIYIYIYIYIDFLCRRSGRRGSGGPSPRNMLTTKEGRKERPGRREVKEGRKGRMLGKGTRKRRKEGRAGCGQ
jgi:hypothetical protein